MVNKNKKRTVRAGAITLGTMMMLMATSPAAHALRRDDGDDPGPGLSVVETLGYFVIAPIVLFAVIAGLVMLTDKTRKPTS
ncbi:MULTISPECIES: hypothetical protein [Streptomyces]|uniref:hypothetical protein n=1 Tax=Streptomyces TaxID=1883 RepID=UPI001D13120A|nr:MULTISPECIES: hypothetical protein [Streptomyces]